MELDELRAAISKMHDRPEAGREAGSGYACCANGVCPQHSQFWDYERKHGYLGRSRVNQDDA